MFSLFFKCNKVQILKQLNLDFMIYFWFFQCIIAIHDEIVII